MSAHAAETIFSFSAEPPRPDWRGLVAQGLQAVNLVRGARRLPGRLRKVSAGGALLHIDSDGRAGERIDLELSGWRASGHVLAWHDGQASMRFETQADVFALLARNLVNQPGERRTLPRIEVRKTGKIESASGLHSVLLRDLSQRGAGFDAEAPLVVGETVTLRLDGLPEIGGQVRWRTRESAGLSFGEELGWQVLMPWLKQHREPAATGRTLAPTGIAVPNARPVPHEVITPAKRLQARVRDGLRRWTIDVESVSATQIVFESYSAVPPGSLLWIGLPGLEGWPARVQEADGYRVTCAFAQPLHPAVLDKVRLGG